jgi:hypothetical protein
VGSYHRGPALAGPRFLLTLLIVTSVGAAEPVREATWASIAPPVQQLLARHGLHEQNFVQRVGELRARNRQRVRDGDYDHLIYYALQATAFTRLAPIEPALSAREFAASGRIPASAKARLDAFRDHEGTKTDHEGTKARRKIFQEMLERERVDLSKEYARVMKSVAPVGEQYQARGLSTDTAVEAGYAVYLSLAALRRLEPERQIRHALIIGPGMDLAPRTGFMESAAPQSYQPFAVMDALLATGLSQRDVLRVTAADINPRVVEWITRSRGTTPTLTLTSGVQDSARVKLTDDYREYAAQLGRAIGVKRATSLRVAGGITGAIDAAVLDITVDRIDARYDLVIVTNVFPYLSDTELLLAVSNISAMLSPNGIFIHNEPRAVLAEALHALQMPLLHNRSGVVARVDGGTPLYDAVWMHVTSGRVH